MTKSFFQTSTTCRLCGSERVESALELSPTPPGDLFLTKDRLENSKQLYPLTLALCLDCGYAHLPYLLDPVISYSNYVYETKVTVGLSNHYQEYATNVASLAGANPSALAIDLGSNDGTMLKAFRDLGLRVLGIEPNERIAEVANKNGLNTISGYFSESIATHIVQEYGKALIVTANYMYANIADVEEFTNHVKTILDPQGIFVVQTGYHPEQMKLNMFDYIYHEHYSYFTVKVLKKHFERCNLELVDVSLHKAKGGSIRAVAQHKGGRRKPQKSVGLFIKSEDQIGVHKPTAYMKFSEKLDGLKIELTALLNRIKETNKSIVGYGASHSTTTLLYHFDIGHYIDYIVDDNSIKHGLFSPGYHLPVYPASKLNSAKPEYALILGWQHRESIINRNREFLSNGGRFIVPLPKLVVVE